MFEPERDKKYAVEVCWWMELTHQRHKQMVLLNTISITWNANMIRITMVTFVKEHV